MNEEHVIKIKNAAGDLASAIASVCEHIELKTKQSADILKGDNASERDVLSADIRTKHIIAMEDLNKQIEDIKSEFIQAINENKKTYDNALVTAVNNLRAERNTILSDADKSAKDALQEHASHMSIVSNDIRKQVRGDLDEGMKVYNQRLKNLEEEFKYLRRRMK